MKKLSALILFSLVTIGLFAQDFEVPRNYEFSKKEDYARYEGDILNCIDWLLNTPVKENPAKRKEGNAFLIQWLTGTPAVSVEINPGIVSFMEPNAELLIVFMAGWTKFTLQTGEKGNKVKGNMNGLEAVMDFYTKNRENLKKDKNVEKYIKMKEQGKLEEYVRKNS